MKRRAFALLCTMIGVTIASGVALMLSQRDRPLLFIAARIDGADCRDVDCKAIGPREYISVDIPDSVNATHSPIWRRRCLQTGIEEVRRLTTCPHGSTSVVETSPDGNWILCYSYSGSRNAAALVDARTGRSSRWTSVGDLFHEPIHWMLDSKRWLSLGNAADGYALVYNVEKPSEPARLKTTDSETVNRAPVEVAGPDRLFVIDRTDRKTGLMRSDGADLTEYRIGSQIERVATHSPRPPVRGHIYSSCISPRGDRISWNSVEHRVPAFSRWIQQFIHNWPVPDSVVVSLWTSDLDGSHVREIGQIPLDRESGPPYFEWLPDGHHLSFIHTGSLFIVAD